LLLTPLGLLRIPVLPFAITTLHIPVIIGGCLLGWKQGAFLGGMFGLASFINNSFIAPGPFSFVFTPFYSMPQRAPELLGNANEIVLSGNFWSILICFIPRIMVGIVAGLTYKLLSKNQTTKYFGAGLAGILGSITNTLLVMGGIALFFGNDFAFARGVIGGIPITMTEIFLATIATNAIGELAVAVVTTIAVVIPLSKMFKTKNG